MKKNMIFSGAMSMMTALLLCTACSSDDVTTDKATAAVPEGKVIHYTATVGEGDETRATLNGEKKYEFQEGDKLVITGTNISGELTLATGAGTASATFSGDLTYTVEGTPANDLELKAVLVSTNNAMTTLTYDAAEYPTTAIVSTMAEAVEKYSHFTATSTYGAKNFTVSQQTSFLNFTVTFSDGTAANTDFDIVIKNGGSTVRTGSVTTAEVDSKVVAQFVAAMPKGTTMSSATVQLGTKSAIAFGGTTTLAANKIYNIKKTVAPSVPENALSGQFTVGMDGSTPRKVYFSKGNLQYDGTNWKFADNQYDYLTTHDGTNWDKFGWSTSATNYGMNTSTLSSSYSSDFVDWGATMGTGWFTLSSAEWTYLFNTRTVNNGTGSGKSYSLGQKVNDVLGVVLYPDNYTGAAYTTAQSANWSSFEASGCVFLPAAGYRYGTSVSDVGSYGSYWSSSASGTDSAYGVYFGSGLVYPADNNGRGSGFSVRLVRPVE